MPGEEWDWGMGGFMGYWSGRTGSPVPGPKPIHDLFDHDPVHAI